MLIRLWERGSEVHEKVCRRVCEKMWLVVVVLLEGMSEARVYHTVSERLGKNVSEGIPKCMYMRDCVSEIFLVVTWFFHTVHAICHRCSNECFF